MWIRCSYKGRSTRHEAQAHTGVGEREKKLKCSVTSTTDGWYFHVWILLCGLREWIFVSSHSQSMPFGIPSSSLSLFQGNPERRWELMCDGIKHVEHEPVRYVYTAEQTRSEQQENLMNRTTVAAHTTHRSFCQWWRFPSILLMRLMRSHKKSLYQLKVSSLFFADVRKSVNFTSSQAYGGSFSWV